MTVALAGSPYAYVVSSPALCGTPQNVGLFSTLPVPSESCLFSLFRVAVSCRISTVSVYAVVGFMQHMLLSWATWPVRLRTMSLNSRFVTRVSLPIHHAASHVALRLGADRAIPHCPAHPQDDRPTSRFHVKSLFYSVS